jgi:anaerobic magnesium-protoporphyrin IX monomethyl ester cyclase
MQKFNVDSGFNGAENKGLGKRCDVAFIYPPWAVVDGRATLQNSLPPLGILSMASYLESLGYSVVVYDVHGEGLNDDDVRERLRRDRPRFVGISVLTSMAIPAHKIAKICKEELADCVVVAGGTHAEAVPERMLKNSSIDVIVRGDGEEPMRQIVEEVAFSEIKGLSFRKGQSIQHNEAGEILMDLDKYPFPAYHLVDFKNYFPGTATYRHLPAINMLSTRGCPGACVFCNSAFTTLRTRDPIKVAEQIRHLRENYGIRQVQFYDDTFTVMKKFVLEFCKKMVEMDLDISWSAYIRGDCFSDQMALAMKQAGCHQVILGIETGNAKIAERMGKPITRERYLEAVEISHRHGIEVRGSFIIGHMGETWETMEDTLNFAIEMDCDLFQLSINTPYPGTALYNEAKKNGMLIHQDWYRYGQGQVLIDQPQLSTEDIYKFERLAFRKFYLRPKPMYRLLKRLTSFRHIRDYLLAAYILLLGQSGSDRKDWSCWMNLKEEDYLDLILDNQDEILRLTYELRQESFAT